MTRARLATGAAGEDAVLRAYRRRGYELVARNWRCRLGELDLVLARDELLVICEVKTRRGSAFGWGWESVDPRKQHKLRTVATAFLSTRPSEPPDVRFDVASVRMSPDGSADVEVYEDAF